MGWRENKFQKFQELKQIRPSTSWLWEIKGNNPFHHTWGIGFPQYGSNSQTVRWETTEKQEEAFLVFEKKHMTQRRKLENKTDYNKFD